MISNHYSGREAELCDLFGADRVRVRPDALEVDDRVFPIVDGVVVTLAPSQYTSFIRSRLAVDDRGKGRNDRNFAEAVQYGFGAEWSAYSEILPEHKDEFAQYFDLVDIDRFRTARVCDLGCGSGRWSYYLADRCRSMVLVDFSDAIFVARRNLAHADRCLFFMADLRALPFRPGFADFVISVGVLHHLPTPCLEEVRSLKRWAPECLIYLYYALDNRAAHFRIVLTGVTAARRLLARIRAHGVRRLITRLLLYGVYVPLISVGRLAALANAGQYVPLYETYHGKSLRRIEQDVYDRFFTTIEQRVSKEQILGLQDTYSRVEISPNPPYWHFVATDRVQPV